MRRNSPRVGIENSKLADANVTREFADKKSRPESLRIVDAASLAISRIAESGRTTPAEQIANCPSNVASVRALLAAIVQVAAFRPAYAVAKSS
jgi:hypothetical protein